VIGDLVNRTRPTPPGKTRSLLSDVLHKSFGPMNFCIFEKAQKIDAVKIKIVQKIEGILNQFS